MQIKHNSYQLFIRPREEQQIHPGQHVSTLGEKIRRKGATLLSSSLPYLENVVNSNNALNLNFHL